MNIKRELIATAVRILAENTSLIQKPDTFSEALGAAFGFQSYDQRIASNVEETAAKTAAAVQRIRTHRQFTKITTMK